MRGVRARAVRRAITHGPRSGLAGHGGRGCRGSIPRPRPPVGEWLQRPGPWPRTLARTAWRNRTPVSGFGDRDPTIGRHRSTHRGRPTERERWQHLGLIRLRGVLGCGLWARDWLAPPCVGGWHDVPLKPFSALGATRPTITKPPPPHLGTVVLQLGYTFSPRCQTAAFTLPSVRARPGCRAAGSAPVCGCRRA